MFLLYYLLGGVNEFLVNVSYNTFISNGGLVQRADPTTEN